MQANTFDVVPKRKAHHHVQALGSSSISSKARRHYTKISSCRIFGINDLLPGVDSKFSSYKYPAACNGRRHRQFDCIKKAKIICRSMSIFSQNALSTGEKRRKTMAVSAGFLEKLHWSRNLRRETLL